MSTLTSADLSKLIAVAILLLGSVGCRSKTGSKPDIDWSTEAYSQDRHWRATAQREAGGDALSGGGYDVTTVYLNQADQEKLEVLGIDDHLLSEAELHMNWTEPRHLEIIVDSPAKPVRPQDLIFQAIRCGNVTISLELRPFQNGLPAH